MTAYPRHAFDVAPGQPQPTVFTPLAQFFRRLVAAVRRKPAAPEAPSTPSGAATSLLTGRFPCCEHCTLEDLSQCDPPDNHPVACSDGCNAAQPVLGDRMIADVRAEYDEFPCATPAAHGKTAPYLCTLPPHHCLSPEGEPATPAPWRLSAAMTTGELTALDERTGALLQPVNGRPLGTQPRRHPDDGQAVNVERDMARAAGLRDRERYEPASVPLLRQVLGALRNLDTPAAGYRGGWQ